jgi:hypothetical protein
VGEEEEEEAAAGAKQQAAAAEEQWVLRAYALNRPLHGTVQALTGIAGLGELGQLQLFLGGPAQPGSLSVLHRFKELPQAVPVDGDVGGEEEEAEAEAEGASARCGLYLGGSLEAINELLRSGRASAQDFRVTLGCTELLLGSGSSSSSASSEQDLQLPEPHQWLTAAGSAVAAAALCPPLPAPAAAVAAAAAAAAGGGGAYNSARFSHQNTVWARLLLKLAQQTETAEAARGKELGAFASPLAHAAVGSYVAAGWTQEDMQRLLQAQSS